MTNIARHSSISTVLSSTLIASIVAFPLLAVAWLAIQSDGEIWQHLQNTLLFEYTKNSLLLALGVGILTLATGIGSAWIVAKYRFRGRQFIQWALLLPLAMPAYITAYSYTGIFDASGPLQQWFRDSTGLQYGEYWFPNIHSLGGAIFVMAAVLYPYIYLLARSAFLEQSNSLQKSAQVLGYSHLQSFRLIALPIARPAIIAGLLLVLMETFADYGTVAYFGVDTYTTGIFRAWFGLGSVYSAAKLSLILLGFVLILMTLERQSRKHAQFYEKSQTGKNKLLTLNGYKNSLALFACCIPIAIGFVIPVSQLFLWALENWGIILNSDFLQLARNSLLLAGATAILAVSIAVILSYCKRSSNHPIVSLNHSTVLSGYALPGTVITVGVMIPLATFDNAINDWLSIKFVTNGTLIALIIGYLTRFLSIATQTVDSGLKKVSPQIEYSARGLGLNKRQVLWRIHLPIINTSLLTAGLIVFVDVMKELPTTLILRPFNFNTLAVKSFELASDEQLAEAAPAALSIVLFGLIPVILLSKAIDRNAR